MAIQKGLKKNLKCFQYKRVKRLLLSAPTHEEKTEKIMTISPIFEGWHATNYSVD